MCNVSTRFDYILSLKKMMLSGYGGVIGGKGSGLDAYDMPPKSPGYSAPYRQKEDFGSMGSRKFSRY